MPSPTRLRRRRRTKIIATLGPSSSSPEMLGRLFRGGADVFRLNFSHGSHEDHAARIALIRALEAEAGRPIGILADVQGPKLRVGRFGGGRVHLQTGQGFRLDMSPIPGDSRRVELPHPEIMEAAGIGTTLLLDDGKLRLRVVHKRDGYLETEVVTGGPLSDRKGVNVPDMVLPIPALTKKDHIDLRFALDQGVEYIGLSFVQRPEDVAEARDIADGRAWIMTKLEKPQALDNLDGILALSDCVMVARGDLGVELPLEDVPLAQKRIVEAARRKAKPVIVATQVLESMITSPRPTRAEASDAANAVLDGADALMLSAETSVGEYPVEAVSTMARIAEATEEHGLDRVAKIAWDPHSKGGIITFAAAQIAERIGARFLVAFTQTGDSARRLSRYRSNVPVIACTPLPEVARQLTTSWGVETRLTPPYRHTDEMVLGVDRLLLESGHVERGDVVVIVAGSPPGIPGSTNAVRVHVIGDAVSAVAPAYVDADAPVIAESVSAAP